MSLFYPNTFAPSKILIDVEGAYHFLTVTRVRRIFNSSSHAGPVPISGDRIVKFRKAVVTAEAAAICSFITKPLFHGD